MQYAGRLATSDSVVHYVSRRGQRTDWFAYLVFAGDSEKTPSREDVIAHFASRAEYVSTLQRRLETLAGGLQQSYWVQSDVETTECLTFAGAEAISWGEFVSEIERLAETRLDSRRLPWEGHVYLRLTDVPGITGEATAVVLHCAHDLMVGGSLGDWLTALFGDDPAPLVVPGLPEPAPRPLPVHRVVGAAVSVPLDVFRFVATTLVRSRKRQPAPLEPAPHIDGLQLRAWLDGRVIPSGAQERHIRIVPRDARELRVAGTSVTATVLTAISFAVQRYIAETTAGHHQDLMFAAVPVQIAGDDLPVNNIALGVVDLCGDVPGIADRAAAIDAKLRAERRRLNSPELNGFREAQAAMPFALVRLMSQRTSPPVEVRPMTYTSLSSVPLGNGKLALLGRPMSLASAYQGGEAGLAHTLIGHQDSLVILAACHPGMVESLDRYVQLLDAALDEVLASLRGTVRP